jgi:hypothetical protein
MNTSVRGDALVWCVRMVRVYVLCVDAKSCNRLGLWNPSPSAAAVTVQAAAVDAAIAAEFLATKEAAEWPTVDFAPFSDPAHVARVRAVQECVRTRPPGTIITTRKATPTHQIGVREYVLACIWGSPPVNHREAVKPFYHQLCTRASA